MSPLPILWSFRRCPYAIRARLAIACAGLPVELREVNLSCKPPELLQIWPAGTVPVLQTEAEGVISESLAVMRWALAQRDPNGWLWLPAEQAPGPEHLGPALHHGPMGPPEASGDPEAMGSDAARPALPAPIAALIQENDGPFKHHLDRFKYASRFPGSDPRQHREEGLRILRRWDGLLRGSAEAAPGAGPGEPRSGAWLLGGRACLADLALLPFVRQFRLADPGGFAAAEGLGALRVWLERYERSPELAAVMAPPLACRQPWRSPRWLYHLALADEWRQARAEGVYRRSTRGLSLEQVGFIHASQAAQIAATYQRFYGDADGVTLLTLDPQRLEAAGVVVRMEPAADGSGEHFPHLYGALPLEAVLAAEAYRP